MDKSQSMMLSFLPSLVDKQKNELKKYIKKIRAMQDFENLDICILGHLNPNFFINRNYSLIKAPMKITDTIKNYLLSISNKNLGGGEARESIYIYLDNIIAKKIKAESFKLDESSLKEICTFLMIALYHEKRHVDQKEFKDENFTSIMSQMECLFFNTTAGKKHYKSFHDDWYIELDANLYGATKVLDYYQRKHDEDHIDVDYASYYAKVDGYRRMTYDFDYFFSNYNKLRKNPFYRVQEVRKDLIRSFKGLSPLTWRKYYIVRMS